MTLSPVPGFVLALTLLSAGYAVAQEAPTARADSTAARLHEVVRESGVAESLQRVATATAPDLERVLEELTGTLSSVADRIAGDPELRGSALRAALALTDVAGVVLVEQVGLMQEMLRTAAERLEALGAQAPQRR